MSWLKSRSKPPPVQSPPPKPYVYDPTEHRYLRNFVTHSPPPGSNIIASHPKSKKEFISPDYMKRVVTDPLNHSIQGIQQVTGSDWKDPDPFAKLVPKRPQRPSEELWKDSEESRWFDNANGGIRTLDPRRIRGRVQSEAPAPSAVSAAPTAPTGTTNGMYSTFPPREKDKKKLKLPTVDSLKKFRGGADVASVSQPAPERTMRRLYHDEPTKIGHPFREKPLPATTKAQPDKLFSQKDLESARALARFAADPVFWMTAEEVDAKVFAENGWKYPPRLRGDDDDSEPPKPRPQAKQPQRQEFPPVERQKSQYQLRSSPSPAVQDQAKRRAVSTHKPAAAGKKGMLPYKTPKPVRDTFDYDYYYNRTPSAATANQNFPPPPASKSLVPPVPRDVTGSPSSTLLGAFDGSSDVFISGSQEDDEILLYPVTTPSRSRFPETKKVKGLRNVGSSVSPLNVVAKTAVYETAGSGAYGSLKKERRRSKSQGDLRGWGYRA